MSDRIPFTKVHRTGSELDYVRQVVEASRLAGDGTFTRRCEAILERLTGGGKALLTHSCTAALEMAAILAGIREGDEVVMPSFTFVSTANAFVLRGAVPVFVDVKADTLTLDPDRVRSAITPRTKAIVPVHYAGVCTDMDAVLEIAEGVGALVIEDAAQALLSRCGARMAGSIGQMAALSFHETKNVTSGEGGALLINDPKLLDRAEVVREKGTDRAKFFRGEVDKYTWRDIGSSYLPGELVAAFLLAQLERADWITSRRLDIWRMYHDRLEGLEREGFLRRPPDLPSLGANGHLYYVLVADLEERTRVIASLRHDGVGAVFHYVPLHDSPAGRRLGRTAGRLPVTEDVANRLVRLPLWPDMTERHVEAVIAAVRRASREPGSRHAL
jgi:dTDP-4-amino-4,6-dideoxygalactose transaminase